MKGHEIPLAVCATALVAYLGFDLYREHSRPSLDDLERTLIYACGVRWGQDDVLLAAHLAADADYDETPRCRQIREMAGRHGYTTRPHGRAL